MDSTVYDCVFRPVSNFGATMYCVSFMGSANLSLRAECGMLAFISTAMFAQPLPAPGRNAVLLFNEV